MLTGPNKEFITELIDNTDLIFYVFNKNTDLVNYDTFKKCYDAVNRLWCEKCGVNYPGYNYGEGEHKRILWHQEAMKKRPCYSAFHYYWVTIFDSSVNFEYLISKFFRICKLWDYNTNMPNGRETIPSKFIPYCFARYLPTGITFVCDEKKSYKDFIEHYNAKKQQELEKYKELQKKVQTSEDEKKNVIKEKNTQNNRLLLPIVLTMCGIIVSTAVLIGIMKGRTKKSTAKNCATKSENIVSKNLETKKEQSVPIKSKQFVHT